uniref:Uncharacterized protein n=1 Tax=Timema bartmani TaxID=61472 RepID=A0A7R9I297_9NEOP|nr:unnamed protein product [Timema bartmani]
MWSGAVSRSRTGVSTTGPTTDAASPLLTGLTSVRYAKRPSKRALRGPDASRVGRLTPQFMSSDYIDDPETHYILKQLLRRKTNSKYKKRPRLLYDYSNKYMPVYPKRPRRNGKFQRVLELPQDVYNPVVKVDTHKESQEEDTSNTKTTSLEDEGGNNAEEMPSKILQQRRPQKPTGRRLIEDPQNLKDNARGIQISDESNQSSSREERLGENVRSGSSWELKHVTPLKKRSRGVKSSKPAKLVAYRIERPSTIFINSDASMEVSPHKFVTVDNYVHSSEEMYPVAIKDSDDSLRLYPQKELASDVVESNSYEGSPQEEDEDQSLVTVQSEESPEQPQARRRSIGNSGTFYANPQEEEEGRSLLILQSEETQENSQRRRWDGMKRRVIYDPEILPQKKLGTPRNLPKETSPPNGEDPGGQENTSGESDEWPPKEDANKPDRPRTGRREEGECLQDDRWPIGSGEDIRICVCDYHISVRGMVCNPPSEGPESKQGRAWAKRKNASLVKKWKPSKGFGKATKKKFLKQRRSLRP